MKSNLMSPILEYTVLIREWGSAVQATAAGVLGEPLVCFADREHSSWRIILLFFRAVSPWIPLMQPLGCLQNHWAHEAKASLSRMKAVRSWEVWHFALTPLAPSTAPTHIAPELMGTDRWMSPEAPW